MGNATWACFDCREAVRRPTHYRDAVPCPRCRCTCRCLGTRIRVPVRGDEPAWRGLRARIREQRLADRERIDLTRVRLRHQIERQVADLEARPSNEGRTRAIQLLRQRLAPLPTAGG